MPLFTVQYLSTELHLPQLPPSLNALGHDHFPFPRGSQGGRPIRKHGKTTQVKEEICTLATNQSYHPKLTTCLFEAATICYMTYSILVLPTRDCQIQSYQSTVRYFLFVSSSLGFLLVRFLGSTQPQHPLNFRMALRGCQTQSCVSTF